MRPRPARITAGSNLPFGEYDDFITSAAIQFIWATQEEQENVDMWSKVVQMAGGSASAMSLTKQIMEREGIDVNNLSRIVPKGTPPA